MERHEYKGYTIQGEVRSVIVDHPGNTKPLMFWQYCDRPSMAFASQISGVTLDDVKKIIDEKVENKR